MADAVLLFGGQLGHGARSPFHQEDRVVAEAAGPSRRAGDAPLAHALRLERAAVRCGDDDHRPEAGGALLVRHVPQLREEHPHLIGMRCVLSSITGGMQAGCASQRVHLQAGVVRQRHQARRPRVGLGLPAGIIRVGLPDFLHLQRQANILRGEDLPATAGQERAQLADLARVGGGEQQT